MIKRLSDSEILQMLGLRFRQYRVALGLTQAELSAKAGVSIMTIHMFETGTARNVTATTLISLMRYTGLIENLDTLIPDIPESPYSNLTAKQRVRHDGNKK
ncbi:MAG: helix-turn-helix domain-containing protein [Bacteroidales bacterium]|nr:helix-turn-helix domain-containing protein [Bacteroidales bacterium]